MSAMKCKTWLSPSERLVIPESYKSILSLRETENAIKYIKDNFQVFLANNLNLNRVSAPISLLKRTGLNDHLSGKERPVSFNISCLDEEAEIVQSLAKWKRNTLARYDFQCGEGLYTDMNAIRPDEDILDNLHSIYVDQWDWELIIKREERTTEFLKSVVRRIYDAVKKTESKLYEKYPELLTDRLPEDIYFIHSQDLLERYPGCSPKERENLVCEEYGAVFLIGIGGALSDGKPHDERAADYDDWSTSEADGRKGLNGDILVWYPPLGCTLELSSMGIRVDEESLQNQLAIKNELFKTELYYHNRLLNGELPLTIGGGIGQSRLCMFYLKKIFIGEVQVGIWSEELIKMCCENSVPVL